MSAYSLASDFSTMRRASSERRPPPAGDAGSEDEIDAEPGGPAVLLIEGRPLIRDCLARCIRRGSDVEVRTIARLEMCAEAIEDGRVSLAMLVVESPADADHNLRLVARLREITGNMPIIVVCDGEDLSCIVRVMKAGVRGYISTDMALDVAIEAIRLVQAGGQFLPAKSVLEEGSAAAAPVVAGEIPSGLNGIFTTRQAAVVEALRKGMANKIIAYELNMQESTVKVHVRNIMKKLKARNRTEVAYLANQLLD